MAHMGVEPHENRGKSRASIQTVATITGLKRKRL
jgi:hypothetical protein